MKILLLSMMFSLAGFVLFAQKGNPPSPADPAYDTAYVLHYNFLDGKLRVPKRIHWHPPVYRPFVIQIDSINRGAFKIRIGSRDSIIANSDPAQFTNVFNQLQQLKPKVPAANASDSAEKQSLDQAAADNKDAKKPTDAAKLKQDNTSLAVTGFALVTNEGEVESFTSKVMQDKAIKTDPEKLPAFKDDVQKDKKLEKLDSSYIRARKAAYYQLQNLYYNLRLTKRSLLSLSDSISGSIVDIEKAMVAMKHRFMTKAMFDEQYRATEGLLRQHLLSAKKLYSRVPGIASELEVWQTVSKQFFNDTVFKKVDSVALVNVEKVYNSMHVDSLLNSLGAINLNLSYLGSDYFYRYTSPPITPWGDIVIVNVAITALNQSDTTLKEDEKNYELKLFTKNRFRFDFSTGLGTLFNLADKSYHTTQVGTDSVHIVENSRTQKVTPLIAAFLHAGYDIGSSFKPALTFGLSLDASSADITTFLLGGSLMMGRDEKLELTAGWAVKKIAVLKSDFNAGSTYARTDIGSTVPTESVFRSGWFLSLSYNLTNKPSQK